MKTIADRLFVLAVDDGGVAGCCPHCSRFFYGGEATIFLPVNGVKVFLADKDIVRCPCCGSSFVAMMTFGSEEEAVVELSRCREKLSRGEQLCFTCIGDLFFGET